MKLGIDVDGVLTDFVSGYVERIIKVAGDKFGPDRPVKWPTWDSDIDTYHYTTEERKAVWANIVGDSDFWRSLPSYPTTQTDVSALDELSFHDDVYFITARPGVEAKVQTEDWLVDKGIMGTVLISSAKGMCASALELDAYIDDKPDNLLDVFITRGHKTKLYLLTRPWNVDFTSDSVRRVTSVCEMLDDLKRQETPTHE